MSDKDTSRPDIKIASLYKHWVTADAVKARMLLSLPNGSSNFAPEFEQMAQSFSCGQTLVVFYSLLHVVVEGYRELKLQDEELDELLANGTFADKLRRFRNAVFHYQEDPFDQRLIDFLNIEASSDWTMKLHAAFNRFFRATLPIDEMMAAMRSA